jgi:hypothetical protein
MSYVNEFISTLLKRGHTVPSIALAKLGEISLLGCELELALSSFVVYEE